jgi:hypothetical protein
MKTKIQVKRIEDPDTEVSINSPEHLISEIKKEISDCTTIEKELAQAEVIEMCGNDS